MLVKLFAHQQRNRFLSGKDAGGSLRNVEDDRKFHIRFNMLGPHNVVIDGRKFYKKDLQYPNHRAWVAFLYLALHRQPVDQIRMVGEAWPDEPENASCDTLHQALSRLHNDLAVYEKVRMFELDDGMIRFSDNVRVTTDADEMEELFKKTKNMPDCDEKMEMLKKASSLYRGSLLLQEEAVSGTWLMPYTAHYNQVFVDITTELLKMLGRDRRPSL